MCTYIYIYTYIERERVICMCNPLSQGGPTTTSTTYVSEKNSNGMSMGMNVTAHTLYYAMLCYATLHYTIS